MIHGVENLTQIITPVYCVRVYVYDAVPKPMKINVFTQMISQKSNELIEPKKF